MEIYHNTIEVVRRLVEESGIDKEKITGLGISNQRETSLAWDRETGGTHRAGDRYGSAPGRWTSVSGWKSRAKRN